MANFLRTVLLQNSAPAADGVVQVDLPVNPLSMILVTLRSLVVAGDTLTSTADLLAMVSSVGVSFRGQDIVRGSLADLAMVNAVVCGSTPWGIRQQDATNDVATITVPICFGRRPYMVSECFPAVRRGDLVLEMTLDVAVGNWDTLVLQVETVELLDETPGQYLKYVAASHTFSSTGEEDVRLPIGNPLLGVLLRGTTVPAAGASTATWERFRLKVDNVEALYARANWDTLQGEMGRRIWGAPDFIFPHVHSFNGAAAAFADTLHAKATTPVGSLYGYMDFDPLQDSAYMLETAGRADVVIHRDAGVADLGVFFPIELVKVAGASGGAA